MTLLADAAADVTADVDLAPRHGYEVIEAYPHARDAFTQGLLWLDGHLYESTGLNGASSVRKVDLRSGEVLQMVRLDRRFFGEGLVAWEDTLIQLTLSAGLGIVFDRETFEVRETFRYPGEGWGITHDGRQLIMSDGSADLRLLDPATFEQVGTLAVRDRGAPVENLNELEYVNGEIFANIWRSDRIARISPETGQVTGWIDLEGLLGPGDREEPVDVLNGIAHDAENDRLFVTGKLWPKLFEIRLVPAP